MKTNPYNCPIRGNLQPWHGISSLLRQLGTLLSFGKYSELVRNCIKFGLISIIALCSYAADSSLSATIVAGSGGNIISVQPALSASAVIKENAIHHDWALPSGVTITSNTDILKHEQIVISNALSIKLENNNFLESWTSTQEGKVIIYLINKADIAGSNFDSLIFVHDAEPPVDPTVSFGVVMHTGFFDHNTYTDSDSRPKPNLFISKIGNVDAFPNIMILVAENRGNNIRIKYEWQLWDVISQKLIKVFPQKDTGPFVTAPQM